MLFSPNPPLLSELLNGLYEYKGQVLLVRPGLGVPLQPRHPMPLAILHLDEPQGTGL